MVPRVCWHPEHHDPHEALLLRAEVLSPPQQDHGKGGQVASAEDRAEAAPEEGGGELVHEVHKALRDEAVGYVSSCHGSHRPYVNLGRNSICRECLQAC